MQRDDLQTMHQSVGTAAVVLAVTPQQAPVIQNLGPGNLYIDSNPGVTTNSGLKLAVGDTYEYPRDLAEAAGSVYAIADQAATDVRILVVG